VDTVRTDRRAGGRWDPRRWSMKLPARGWLRGPNRLRRELAGVPVLLWLAYIVILGPLPKITPGTGSDPSWILGLNLFSHFHLKFGPQLLFTYGPWGMLDYPLEVSRRNLVLAQVFSVLVVTVTWLVFYTMFRRLTTPTRAAVVTTVLALCTGQLSVASSQLLITASAAALSYLGWRRPGRLSWLPAAVAASGAFLVQVKFSEGLILTAIAGVCVVFAPDRKPVRAAETALTWLVVTVVAWLGAGQSLGDYPGWFRDSITVASGYTDAMSFEAKPNVVPYLLMILVITAVAVYHVRLFHDGNRYTALALLIVSGMLLLLGVKEGSARHSVGHAHFFFLVAVPVLAWFLVAGRGSTARIAVLVAAAVLCTTNWLPTRPAGVVQGWSEPVQAVVDSQYQAQQEAAAKAAAQRTYGLNDQLKSALAGAPVAVDTIETAVVWAYDLRWSPAPTMQTYLAYTASLDQKNATWAANAPADQRILRSGLGALEGRNALWDSPRYVLNEVCRYRPIASQPQWMVLAKSTDRCGSQQALSTVAVQRNAAVQVPTAGPDQLVVMSFHERRASALVRLGRLIDKSYHRLEITGNGRKYPVPRALGNSPLIVRIPPSAGWSGDFLQHTPFQTVSFSEPGSVTFSVIQLSA
jgi:hypothetical protein